MEETTTLGNEPTQDRTCCLGRFLDSLRSLGMTCRLNTGLYLVGGSAAVIDGKSIATDPFLVSLPSLDGSGNWAYKLILSPKFSAPPVPETPETVSCRVLKLWQGDVKEFRPENIRVRLLQDGAVYDTVELTKEGAWRHSWENLPSKDSLWTVRKVVPPGYSVAFWQEGETFVLQNSFLRAKLPQTGQLWWPVPILALGGLALLAIGLGLQKRQRHE